MNVLKNEKYLQYERISRYSQFPYYYNTLDNKYICSTTAYLDDSTTYNFYTVKDGDTYDSIALEMYGNPTYYWLICSFNRIQNPFDLPERGSQIKIPVLTDIEFEAII